MKINNKKTKHPFQYEEPLSLDDYTEEGMQYAASISENEIDCADFKRLILNTEDKDFKSTLDWIENNKGTFSESTIITDTDDGKSLKEYDSKSPNVFILTKPLNNVRHLNNLLNCANEGLADNGYLWCHCVTSTRKILEIMRQYPRGINRIAYFFHYIWHRIIPKLSLTKWFYMAITKGTNRFYHRVEVLGRLYRAGFEVIEEEFRHGEFFVYAKKIKDPIWDDEPTGSPLIKLRRIGKDGEIIGVYKFRTMYSYSEYLQPYIYKHNNLAEGGKFADDYRINGWGKLLRKFWLDEIPMFINVLKGQMKIVGVRPLSKHYFSLYTPEMQQLRVKVKPGMLPPFYYEKVKPVTLDDVQESEKRYILAYLEHPFRTDVRYFLGTFKNIVFKGERSS